MAVTSQKLVDTKHHVVYKLTNINVDETSVVKVNASTLLNAAHTLTLTGITGTFVVGESVKDVNGTGDKLGKVISWSSPTLVVAWKDPTQTEWADADALKGLTSLAVGTIDTGGVANSSRLTLSKLEWASQTKEFHLEWGGGTPSTIGIFSGNGSLNLSTSCLPPISNNAVSPTGDVLLTTMQTYGANDSYFIIMELKKVSGYND